MADQEFKLSHQIQLLPQEELERRKHKEVYFRWLYLIMGILLLFVQGATIFTLYYRGKLEDRLSNAYAGLEQMLVRLEGEKEEEISFRILSQNTNILALIAQEKTAATQTLDLVEASIPTDIHLSELQLADTLGLWGNTVSYPAVFYFIQNLREQEDIADASLSTLSREEETALIQFRVLAELTE